MVPRVLEEHGLLLKDGTPRLHIPMDAIETVVRGYTREAGVRGLQRCLDALCRAAAVHAAGADDGSVAGSVGATDSSAKSSLHPASLAMANAMKAAATGTSSIAGVIPTVTPELIAKVLGPPRYESAKAGKSRALSLGFPGPRLAAI